MSEERRRYCPQCGGGLVTRSLGGVQRLACSADGCGFVFWDNPVPVVAAIAETPEGRVTLARNADWPPGKFGLVTGFLEPSETPEEGVLREVAEELCVEGEIREFVGIYAYYRNNQLLLVYHIALLGAPRAGEELAEIRCLDPGDIRPWPHGTGPALFEWLQSRGHAPQWGASQR